MQVIWSEQALVGDQWLENVRIGIEDGRIATIEPGRSPSGTRTGPLIPAPVNCHSHAFQRAMAGLTEQRGLEGQDSFWTWRKIMFKFLDQLAPDQVEAIAAFVQMEMLEAGFGACVEFHYLHHQPDGRPYDNLAEMSERILAAAKTSGAGLTLLPVMYQFGGCNQRPLGSGQLRFGNDLERFTKLLEAANSAASTMPKDAMLGVAPHSIRAVSVQDLKLMADFAKDGPVHMHLAEQNAEVEEVVAAYGSRPVEWALDNLSLDDRWTLIHCTQMQQHETAGLAATGAVAGLCPLTEANLGDGTFDAVGWLKAKGRFAIGSDSNIRISLAEELRQLETSQRLRDQGRAMLAMKGGSTGRRLLQSAAEGGAQSAHRAAGRIEVGRWADLTALDREHVDLIGLSGDPILDSFVFAGSSEMVRDVWSAGRYVVKDGHHIARKSIQENYVKAVRHLRSAL